MNLVLMVVEKWYAWRASLAMLTWYRRIRREDPQLVGRLLYERILARRSTLTATSAAETLARIEESYCMWPAERAVRYRDVVTYVVVQDYLASHNVLRGTVTDMRLVVARVISREL